MQLTYSIYLCNDIPPHEPNLVLRVFSWLAGRKKTLGTRLARASIVR